MPLLPFHEPLTRSVEDYLKAIYRLSPQGQPATTSEIAHLLDLSAPSVSGMIKRLSEQGLLEHVPYKGVRLTAEGRRAALRMLRRHRLLEAYLVALPRLHLGDGARGGRAAGARRVRHADRADGAALGQSRASIPTAIRSRTPTARSASWSTPRSPKSRSGERWRSGGWTPASPTGCATSLRSGSCPGARVTVVDRQPFRGPITIEVGRRAVMSSATSSPCCCSAPGRRSPHDAPIPAPVQIG